VTPVALSLVLAAACMHAGWNALAKAGRDKFAFLWLAMVSASVLLMPVAVASVLAGGVSVDSLGYLAATGTLHALYFYCLSRAYAVGDLSRVYPIARGLSVALVAVLAWIALAESLSPAGLAGVIVVAVGVFVVAEPWRRGQGSAGVFWAVVTGFIIAAYSVVDKAGVEHTEPVPYVVIMSLIACTLLAPMALRRRTLLATEWRANKRAVLVAATLSLSAYVLVLYAMRLSNAAYVVASRELSIVASVIIGRVLLSEQTRIARVAGAGLIAAGVIGLALV